MWQGLISDYIETRKTLCCVVVILDIRHPLKDLDLELVNWLRESVVPYLLVYTELDKINRGQRQQHASALDAGLRVSASERLLFSAQTGEGKEELISRLARFIEIGSKEIAVKSDDSQQ